MVVGDKATWTLDSNMLENILLWTQRQDAAVQCSVGPSQIKVHDPSGHGTDGDGNWNSSSISLVAALLVVDGGTTFLIISTT